MGICQPVTGGDSEVKPEREIRNGVRTKEKQYLGDA